MATDDINSLLNAGIQAARAGQKQQARRYLEQVLEKQDNNEAAWMWLASVVDTPRERRICLENVLEINPNNARARQALEKLGSQTASEASTQPEAPSYIPPSPRSTSSSPQPPLASPSVDRLAPQGAGVVRTNGPTPLRRKQARSISIPVLVAGIVLAIVLIGLGVFLLVNPGTTPTPVPVAALYTPTTAGQPTAKPLPTLTPNAIFVTIDPNQVTAVATWTPIPSATDLPTATATATLPPISNYTLVFVAERLDRKTPNIYTMPADGKTAEQPLVGGTTPAYSVNISSKGKLVYVTGASPQVAVANADGSQAQIITTLTAKTVSAPVWSPDGKTIAFAADQDDKGEIYTISVDGSNLTKLTNNKVIDQDPAWSPDGKTIVFASDKTDQKSLQLYAMDLATKKTTQLTQSTNDNYSPTFSPDGKMIAFVSTRDGFPNVYTMNADGSNTHLLTIGGTSSTNRDPAWSPDGQYIIFASNRNQQIFNLFLTTLDAKTITQLTNQTSNSYGARFRPSTF